MKQALLAARKEYGDMDVGHREMESILQEAFSEGSQ
tara:strand:+ start:1392 stop:1499 length:108 start_codon:yes stop_codon:yes gene_type:complete